MSEMKELVVWDESKMWKIQGNLKAYEAPYTMKYERVSDDRNGLIDKWTFTFNPNFVIERILGGE